MLKHNTFIRNKAIKALDERLQKQDQLMVSEDWPDLEEEEETTEVKQEEEKSVKVEVEPPAAPATETV